MDTDSSFVLGIGLIAMFIIGSAVGYWAGGAADEREKWCRMKYTELAIYESCLKKPDWQEVIKESK